MSRCCLKLFLAPLLMVALEVTAADFSLTDTQGRLHSLTGYKGKWVVVNLWATWCRPCLDEMPELEALSRSRKDTIVLGLAADGQNAERIRKFTEKLRITYPVIAGEASLLRQFGARGFPTTMLYDPGGNLSARREGPVTRKEIEGMIERQDSQ